MSYCDQIATINVADKTPAILNRLDANISLLATLTEYNIQPKKRQQLMSTVIKDMTAANEKKLLKRDSFGYIVHNRTLYNPSTGVFVLHDGKCKLRYDGYMDEKFVTFLKPVAPLTEDEIYNRNTDPVNVIPGLSKQRNKSSWNGPTTSRFTVHRFVEAVNVLSQRLSVYSDGSRRYCNIRTELNDDVVYETIKNTPMIVYVIMAMMLDKKSSRVTSEMQCFCGKQQHIDNLKIIQAQEESHFDLRPTIGKTLVPMNILLRNARNEYLAMIQMFDTTMLHYFQHTKGCRTMPSLSMSEKDMKYAQENGKLTPDDELYNFMYDNHKSSYMTLDKINVPTNDSLLRLKEIIDETDLKKDTDWAYPGNASGAIVKTIHDANIEYEEICFEPVCNMSEYPQFDTYSQYNYLHPDKNLLGSRYRREIEHCRVLAGIGEKKDIMTMYNVLSEIAQRNEYFREIMAGTELIDAHFVPQFKLDNEIYKDTLCDMLTDEEIEAAMSRVESWSKTYYGIEKYYHGNPAMYDAYSEYYDDKEPFACAFRGQMDSEETRYVPRITFDRSNKDRLQEFYDYVRYLGMAHDYTTNEESAIIGYRDSRDLVAYEAVLNAIYRHTVFFEDACTTSDGFITLERFNPDAVVDGSFAELS